jgi:hypothetical protein
MNPPTSWITSDQLGMKAVFGKLRQNVDFETRCPILRGILDVDLVTWEEHSKNFGYISYSTRIEFLENILNIDAR